MKIATEWGHMMHKTCGITVACLIMTLATPSQAAVVVAGSHTFTETGSGGANPANYIAGLGLQAVNSVEFRFVFNDPLVAPDTGGSYMFFSSDYYIRFNGVDVISSSLSNSSARVQIDNGNFNDSFGIVGARTGDLLPAVLGNEYNAFNFGFTLADGTFSSGQQIVDSSFLSNLTHVNPGYSLGFDGPYFPDGGVAFVSGGRQFELSVSAVPEPTTWAMMLLGFGLVGGATRYHKRRHGLTVSYG